MMTILKLLEAPWKKMIKLYASCLDLELSKYCKSEWIDLKMNSLKEVENTNFLGTNRDMSWILV